MFIITHKAITRGEGAMCTFYPDPPLNNNNGVSKIIIIIFFFL